ncbi:LOB domain-containing protein 15 isoform X1 [Oryza sativa Japonica Group]|uniref:Os05g0165450 protein n=1 Tax=Oryza sativa subsp. japonica TaxID=39947 RepID=C7J2W5_ORYSJ|nr:LOB domain-containing protein 15 isoform X1 [Oryza sativa Japonica Group]BAH92962.1 Os05g0165450 [Oryza sativa Japonica Group]|eukprot:NP_001174234.1 Os05g0165450 [Oryza sativa Japonica Group]
MSTASDWQDHQDQVGRKIKRESSAADAADGRTTMMARRSCSMPAAGAGPGSAAAAVNTITPCAACKLLRRRCAQECPFSPYFSPLEPHKFASVHKVFGASNVSKMLLEVHESQRGDAANSLVYEANLRLRDPVYGCMGAILTLQQQVQALEAELAAVRADIVRHKYRLPSAAAVLPSSHASHLLAAAAAARQLPVAGTMGVVTTATLPASASSSSTTAVYAAASSSTDYSSITNENVPYFS